MATGNSGRTGTVGRWTSIQGRIAWMKRSDTSHSTPHFWLFTGEEERKREEAKKETMFNSWVSSNFYRTPTQCRCLIFTICSEGSPSPGP